MGTPFDNYLPTFLLFLRLMEISLITIRNVLVAIDVIKIGIKKNII
jgi:hypothetical protein